MMKYELSLKQKQKLVLTPQLYQAIHILQLNLAELNTLINKELMENPLLELDQSKSKESDKLKNEADNIHSIDDQNKFQEQLNVSDLLSYLREREYSYISTKTRSNKEDKLENILSYKESLQDYLLFQLGSTTSNSLDFRIGEYIIGNINENGYLNISPITISEDLNIAKEKIFQVLDLIQSFDPPGIGARNLEECLLIQERSLGYKNKNLRRIIKEFLPELAKKSFKKISTRLKIPITEVQKLADVIKNNLDPKPGRQIASFSENKYIIPDLVFRKERNGEYLILQNDSYLPRLKVNFQYKQILDKEIDNLHVKNKRIVEKKSALENQRKETKKYIEEKINSAKQLVKGIEQRRNTIYRIAESLIKHQKEFLDRGILFIKPLTLKEIADDLDLHESTVSRAIHNKYIQTPRGLINMKYLFSKGIDKDSDKNISSEKIKRMILNLVETENPLHPWSDQKIVDLLYLKARISIARRTVAKYRKILNILPYNLRKRY